MIISFKIYFCTFLMITAAVNYTHADIGDMCPSNCTCQILEQSSSLNINCQKRTDTNYSIDTLDDDINRMLIEMNELSQLSIRDTSIIHFPMEVCNLKVLRELHIDNNRIETLPDDCLTRLCNIEIFTADYNIITYLQVWINEVEMRSKLNTNN